MDPANKIYTLYESDPKLFEQVSQPLVAFIAEMSRIQALFNHYQTTKRPN